MGGRWNADAPRKRRLPMFQPVAPAPATDGYCPRRRGDGEVWEARRLGPGQPRHTGESAAELTLLLFIF